MNSEDEDLNRAIALSLQEAKLNERPAIHEPIVISSDDEEDDLPTTSVPAHRYPSKPIPSPPPTAPGYAVSAGTQALLSERAQLEAARLARLKARTGTTEASISTAATYKLASKPPKRRRSRDPDDPFVSSASDSDDDTPLPKKAKASHPPSKSVHSDPSMSANIWEKDGGEMFWDGELRQTANMHVDKEKDTKPVFRLTEILGEKSELKFAILSSYVTQLSWIYSLLPPELPVILVSQPGEDGASSVHNVLPNWVKVTPFLRNGRGCMHMKFLLLFYKSGRLRIVIPTANLVDYDWRDIENSVWVQDVPPHPSPIPVDKKVDDFPSQFERVLLSLNVAPGLFSIRKEHPRISMSSVSDLRCKWDFSKVKAQLVPSIAGKFEGWSSVLRVGHTRLMRVVRLIGAHADPRNPRRERERELEIECQGSSIGTYTPTWIEEFVCSARGASPEGWLDEGRGRRSKRLDGILAQEGWRRWKNIKIIFPSLMTVLESKLGVNGAGTMFCQRKQWMGAKFPRGLFHDSNSSRGKVLMHSKMILATFPDSLSSKSTHGEGTSKSAATLDGTTTELSSEDDEIQEVDTERSSSVLGWLYVGSHNFTPSAWGNLSGSSVTPSMNITNYELGVVLPIIDVDQIERWTCWNRPARKYTKDDEPWIQNRDD